MTEKELAELSGVARIEIKELRPQLEKGVDWDWQRGYPVEYTPQGVHRVKELLGVKGNLRTNGRKDKAIVLRKFDPVWLLVRFDGVNRKCMTKTTENFMPNMEIDVQEQAAGFLKATRHPRRPGRW